LLKEKNKNSLRPHYPAAFPGIIKCLFWMGTEFIINIPRILELRKLYRTRKKNLENPTVVLVGDNLDEVNGIAITSRKFVRTMRKKNRDIYLIGVVFHNKTPRVEMEKGGIIMLPGRCSMVQPGYPHSETTIPRLDIMLKLLKKRPADLVEFETPNTVSHMVLFLSKMIGFKTIHHYRTDIPAYSDLLVKSSIGNWLIQTMVKTFTYMAGPVVVPSDYFKSKVEKLGVIPPHKITKLPRGVDLEHFNPEKATNGAWEKYGNPTSGLRLIFVGRVSAEKNLPALATILPDIFKQFPQTSLTVIGDGPYLETFKNLFSHEERLTFCGVLKGSTLAGMYAAADLLVFPSLFDTFGNPVVEALASGIPALVSNHGGPPEIVEDGRSGLIFNNEQPNDLQTKLLNLLGDRDLLNELKSHSRERAMQFTYEESTERFWEYFKQKVVEL